MEVTEALIERECSVQVRKWRESRGELTHQPSRRLHGTRAIHEHKRRAASISSGGSFSFLGAPPPGPLRASSSLLSLPGFRKSKFPFPSKAKKGSFSGGSGMETLPPQHPSVAASSPSRAPIHTPPPPPMSVAGTKARAPQSPLAVSSPGGSSSTTAQASPGSSAQAHPGAPALTQQPQPPRLSPSSKVVSEQVTPTLPSPTANNAVLPPRPDGGRGAAAPGEEEDGKKKKRSKDDKKKEKEEEKQKLKERKEKEKSEKERQRKEKERAEKEKKKEKGGKKKDKVGGGGGGEAEENNGGAAPRDST